MFEEKVWQDQRVIRIRRSAFASGKYEFTVPVYYGECSGVAADIRAHRTTECEEYWTT